MAGISHGTTDQAAMDSSTKTILIMIVFFLGCREVSNMFADQSTVRDLPTDI